MPVKLFQFPPNWGLPNISPYCLKLELYLKLANISYKNHYAIMTKKAPKKRFPYIIVDGKKIGDSEFIIDWLEKKEKINLDNHLSKSELAICEAFKSLFEEDLFSCILYSRFIDNQFWQESKTKMFGFLPLPIRLLYPIYARKNNMKRLNLNGVLSHTRDEIYSIGTKHVQSIADFIADKPYFMGDKPSRIDATAAAFIINCTHSKIDTPLKIESVKHKNLIAYGQRFLDKYFS